jgi:hypothetical protein
MDFKPPKSIKLTSKEIQLYDRIPKHPHQGDERWDVTADAMEELFVSLIKRNVIPEVRLRLFCDPDYAEKGKKSPKQIFEANGTSGNDIYRHPHFKKYLHYFITGPALPPNAIDGFCKILNDDEDSSGIVLDQLCKHARSMVRKFGFSTDSAGTDFFRLGIEVGMDIVSAKMLRDAVKTTR